MTDPAHRHLRWQIFIGVFLMLLRLFIATLWSPAWKGWCLLRFCFVPMWYPGSGVYLIVLLFFYFCLFSSFQMASVRQLPTLVKCWNMVSFFRKYYNWLLSFWGFVLLLRFSFLLSTVSWRSRERIASYLCMFIGLSAFLCNLVHVLKVDEWSVKIVIIFTQIVL